jgi:hypothetical protein
MKQFIPSKSGITTQTGKTFFIILDKGGLISKSFHFCSNLQTKEPNHSPENFPSPMWPGE